MFAACVNELILDILVYPGMIQSSRVKETQDVCLTRRFLLGSVFYLDLPREPQGIIACCNPVPPLVRQQVNELHLVVQQAREMPLLKVRKDGASAEGVMSEIFLHVVQSPISEGAPLNQTLHYFLPVNFSAG